MLPDAFSLPSVVLLSFLTPRAHHQWVNISQGFARMVAQFSEKCCLFFVVSKGFGAASRNSQLFQVMCFKNYLCLLPTEFFEGNSEKRWLFFVVSEGCGAAFTSKSLLAHCCPMRLHVTDFKELRPVYVASGSLGAVFVNLLSALFRPGRMHLHATVRSPG